MPFDDTSSSDIQMSLWCPATASTAVTMPKVQDDENPVWTSGGCTVTAGALLSGGLAFSAIDVDLTSNDTVTSRTNFLPTEADLRAGSVTPPMSYGGLSSVTLVFTPQ